VPPRIGSPSSSAVRTSLSDVRLWSRSLLRKIERRRSGAPSLESALKAATVEFSSEPHDDPILVLSAGWRSGSTLLQRLINSSGSVLMWGEPLQECGLFAHLADMLLPFDPVLGRLDRSFLGAGSDRTISTDKLADTWTAMLSPAPSLLFDAQRSFLRTLLAEPATAAGFERWGVKETVLPGECAYHLRLLFPRSRIVFLVRDPLTAWTSYRPQAANPWYRSWPHQPVSGPRAFGEMWAQLADSFLRWREPTDAMLVRYEDLKDGHTLDRLEAHLGLSVDRSLVGRSVGSSTARSGYRTKLPAWERYALSHSTGRISDEFGYRN
jgi:hypothetical protein